MAHSKMRRASTDEFFMDEIPEDVHDPDAIEALIYKSMEKHRKHPMSEDAIKQGKQVILDTLGRRPTLTPATAHARSAVTPPFLVMCKRIIQMLENPPEENRKVIPLVYPRGGPAQSLLQATIFKVTAGLRNSILYEEGQRIFAPILYMIDCGMLDKGSPEQRLFAGGQRAAMVSIKVMIQKVQSMTGFQMEGAFAMRKTRLLIAVFDNNETERHALFAFFRLNPSSEEELPMHPTGPHTDEANSGDIVLFDPVYFDQVDTRDAPWINYQAEFLNYIYFDRIDVPYDLLLMGNNKNSI